MNNNILYDRRGRQLIKYEKDIPKSPFCFQDVLLLYFFIFLTYHDSYIQVQKLKTEIG